MANWCNNMIVFEGSPQAIGEIQKLFMAMAEKQQEENSGQLPDFIDHQHNSYFFDIYQEEEGSGIFQYETKWLPNIKVVQQIAKHYQVDFEQNYEELGHCIYGKATFTGAILTNVYLDIGDFDSYEYDEERGEYYFEGETYESENDILDILLERKITGLMSNKQNLKS